ncbi:uncharacterized protein At4g18490 isoform X2 [Brassica rapa]|uniref:uncharacterized protein At4g18490 isoform X2 n=1 Tax=Brassica campestris TaxID=3711 RepID=UPI0004F14664|nr:uncharacterized protein At4g18490 isoform X2 [Brassica rapa]
MSTPAKKSSTEAKENDLMFDKDMEKDTWDFKSMTDDDPMDFGYGSPANKDKKKNAFNMDMSFDLGGDFGSSFKMDMPDFDFSSPAKKTTKTKQKSDDNGDLKQKKNPFHFSCDFDALGDLDLDSSSLKKGNETTTKSMDFEEFAGSKFFDKSDSLDFGPDLPTTKQSVSRANTDVKANASAEKENQNSKGADSMSSTHSKQADSNSSTHSKQATLESKENFEEVDSPQRLRMITSRFHTVRGRPQPANISPLRTSYSKVEENNKPCLSNEKAEPSPLHSSETAHTAASRETSPGSHEICRSGTKEDSPRDTEENANNKMISATKSSYEKTEPNISSLSCLNKIKHQQEEMDIDTQAEIQDHTRRTLCVPDAGHSQTTLPGKVPSGSQLGQTAQVQDSSSKLPQDPSDSVPRLSDLKAMQNSDSGQIRSMFFKKIEKPQSHVLESPTQTEIRPVTRERIGSNVNPTIDKRQDTEDALPGSKTRTAPTELSKTDSETANVNTNSSHEKIIQKDHSGTRTVENVAGLMDGLQLLAKNTTREKSTIQGNISSSNPDASSLTEKLNKHLSSGGESLQKSKMVSLERPKLGNIMSDMRAATQRAIGVNKDQPNSAVQPQVNPSTRNERNTEAPIRKSSEIHRLAPRDRTQALQYRNVGVKKDQTSSAVQPEVSSSARNEKNTEALVRKSSEIHHLAPRDKTQVLQYRTIGGKKDQHSSALQPEARSSISKDRNTEAPVKKISEIHHLAPREKTQILHCPPSLKRKALDEDADRSLMPQLKRFSMSPRENRNVKELTHTVGQVKVSSQASRLDNNTTKQLVKESPRAKSQPQCMNMANLEIPITEYDENIEKAESYTKELDNICNILKKKHEEAKELLVRAVVNNNKLLMLNHPLHEDKIRMVQNFAAKLSLGET